MSGGYFNYSYCHLDDYIGHMEDMELEDLIEDFRELLRDLEWYKSGDTGKEDYRDSVRRFKAKWFKADRGDRLKGYIDKAVREMEKKLEDMISEGEEKA